MIRFREIVSGLMGRRPSPLQVGALCLRHRNGAPEVLLISSLDTGRWIIPKGWPMRGRSLAGAALQEAWEEAGIRGRVRHEALGSFSYDKVRSGGLAQRCEVRVFVIETEAMAERFPEMGRRRREWLAPAEAAARVSEPELQAILRTL